VKNIVKKIVKKIVKMVKIARRFVRFVRFVRFIRSREKTVQSWMESRVTFAVWVLSVCVYFRVF